MTGSELLDNIFKQIHYLRSRFGVNPDMLIMMHPQDLNILRMDARFTEVFTFGNPDRIFGEVVQINANVKEHEPVVLDVG